MIRGGGGRSLFITREYLLALGSRCVHFREFFLSCVVWWLVVK